MIGQDPEMLQMFLDEASEHLGNLEPDLLELEESKDNADHELINRIFRAVHSLKGSAGFFGFENITRLSHIMENLLSLVRDGKLKPSSEMVSSLLNGADKLNIMIDDIDNSEEVEISKELNELSKILNPDKAEEKTVKLEMKENAEESVENKITREFQVAEEDIRKVVAKGHFIYAVKAFTHKDMKNKGRQPLDYINEIGKMGFLLGSYSDIDSISGLDSDSIKNNDIAFIFLFSSVLEPDLISVGLQVEEDQITNIELPKAIAKEKVKPNNIAKATNKVITEEKAKKNEVKTPKKAPKKTIKKNVPKETEKQSKPRKSESSSKNETLRVSVSLLNDLMTLAGELVLARNQLLRMTNNIVKTVPGLQTVTQDINNTTTMLQGKIMDTRMQSISLVFNKFPRVIRDMAKMLDKKIDLKTSGNTVDLDKSIIENLSDPLTHLVRNAADHGLETTAERLAAGKPEVGTVSLRAYHEGGKVNIVVSDDGNGIDPEIIGAKALEKGVVTESDLKRMSEKDILNLIFAPGFSTAEKVSNISGRGVGMDVVKTNIEKLGGSVSIDSVLGEGTTINLKLPLTLAIIPSLIVTVNEMQFALPQVALKELVRIKLGDEKRKIEKVNNAPVLRLRNQLLPIVYLEDVLKLNTGVREQSEITRILVLKNNETEFGLVVDEISDSEEIVVKSIPRFFNKSLCYSGTTIMGDGSVALILDVNGISIQSNLNFTTLQKEMSKQNVQEVEDVNQDLQELLLFENTSDEMFALNLDLIKRIEKVKISDINYVGEKSYIEHDGESLRVIKLEYYLPVKAPENTENDKYYYVIIPTQIENPIGIITHRIVDSVKINVKIDTENITSKGLLGSTLYNDKILLFPDIYELTELADPERAFKALNVDNSKHHILVVEDTPFFRTIVPQYLRSAGYSVDTAIDGIDGLRKIKQKSYDLLVVDIVMPRMDGFEFARNLRLSDEYKDTPAIALTTLNNEETKRKAMESGFNAFQVKIYKDDLLQTIKGLL